MRKILNTVKLDQGRSNYYQDKQAFSPITSKLYCVLSRESFTRYDFSAISLWFVARIGGRIVRTIGHHIYDQFMKMNVNPIQKICCSTLQIFIKTVHANQNSKSNSGVEIHSIIIIIIIELNFIFQFFSLDGVWKSSVPGLMVCRAFRQNQPPCSYYDGTAKTVAGKKPGEGLRPRASPVGGWGSAIPSFISVSASVKRSVT